MNLLLGFTVLAFHRHHDIALVGHRCFSTWSILTRAEMGQCANTALHAHFRIARKIKMPLPARNRISIILTQSSHSLNLRAISLRPRMATKIIAHALKVSEWKNPEFTAADSTVHDPAQPAYFSCVASTLKISCSPGASTDLFNCPALSCPVAKASCPVAKPPFCSTTRFREAYTTNFHAIDLLLYR
jgi:hypothetical protein